MGRKTTLGETRRRRVLLRGANIRKRHPSLYYSVLTVGTGTVALGLNFWFSNPTFSPFGIPKNLIGCVFFAIGFTKLFYLSVIRDLRMVRILLAISISWLFFWGWANAQQFFAGNASLQLPIMFWIVSILQIPLLLEAPVNPMTEKR